MAIPMHQISVGVYRKVLVNLGAILAKATAHAEAKKIEPAALLNARLAPDMYHLTKQVQVVTDSAKDTVALLAGVEAPKFENNETSFADLQKRVEASIAFLDTIKPEQVNGAEDRTITRQFGTQSMEFKGLDYLTGIATPNLYFHASIAYAILRHNGVELGKRDFLGLR